MSLCTHLMGKPFFLGAIPTYGVLPYSMILSEIVGGVGIDIAVYIVSVVPSAMLERWVCLQYSKWGGNYM